MWGRLFVGGGVIVGAGALLAIPVMLYEVWDGKRLAREKKKYLEKSVAGGGHSEYSGDGSVTGDPDRGGKSKGKLPSWSEDPTPWLR